MAKALSAGFHRVAHRALPLPVGSSARAGDGWPVVMAIASASASWREALNPLQVMGVGTWAASPTSHTAGHEPGG